MKPFFIICFFCCLLVNSSLVSSPEKIHITEILDKKLTLIRNFTLPLKVIDDFLLKNHHERLYQKMQKEQSTSHPQQAAISINKFLNKNLEIKIDVLEHLVEELFQEHLGTLPYLHVSNPPLLIMFCGAWGMGKTHTSQKLEEHFKAIRINADQLRILLKKKDFEFGQDTSANVFLEFLLYYYVHRLHRESPNQTIIFDRTINFDAYPMYVKFAKNHAYSIFTIKLFASKKSIIERIKQRENEVQTTEWFLDNLEKSWRRYEADVQRIKYDFELRNNNSGNELPLELIAAITNTISEK